MSSDADRDVDWPDVLARIRREVRRGADRVEVDLDNDIVRGVKTTGVSHG
jgi:hypothetical protein